MSEKITDFDGRPPVFGNNAEQTKGKISAASKPEQIVFPWAKEQSRADLLAAAGGSGAGNKGVSALEENLRMAGEGRTSLSAQAGQTALDRQGKPAPGTEQNVAGKPDKILQGGEKLTMLPVDLVYGNPDQPRKDFDDAALYELSESIKAHGVFSPILVSPDGKGKYMIVAGERRYRASLLAKKSEIPAIVRNFSSRQVAEIALVENLQREDLNPIEAALAMRSLMQEYDLTQEEVASRIGKSRSAVANTLRLLSLSQGVAALVRAGKLSQGHARALLSLPPAVQEEIAAFTVKNSLSVRETEQKVKDYFNPPAEIARKKKELREAKISVELKDLVDRMQRVFKTKISVIGSDKKGRFYVDYYTRDDLERINDLVRFLEECEKE